VGSEMCIRDRDLSADEKKELAVSMHHKSKIEKKQKKKEKNQA
jgi:hypothetical protein